LSLCAANQKPMYQALHDKIKNQIHNPTLASIYRPSSGAPPPLIFRLKEALQDPVQYYTIPSPFGYLSAADKVLFGFVPPI
jgi:hypothetical protein